MGNKADWEYDGWYVRWAVPTMGNAKDGHVQMGNTRNGQYLRDGQYDAMGNTHDGHYPREGQYTRDGQHPRCAKYPRWATSTMDDTGEVQS